ncbi:MAG TPA: hypothetical protein VGK53_07030 [Propionicimonas sp.]
MTETLDWRIRGLGMLIRSAKRMGVAQMPHQGTQVLIWILMCLGLALIWIVTILVVRAVIGGRSGNGTTDAESTPGGDPAHVEPAPRLAHRDNTLTSREPDSYRRRG